MDFQRLKNIFFPRSAPPAPPASALPEIRFKAVVVEFYDNSDYNKGEKLSRILQNCEGLEVACLSETFDKSFLNFESRNLFDLIDKGQSLLEQAGADVLVWGYRSGDQIRLNFQNRLQYQQNDQSFVILLDCLYIPADSLNDFQAFPDALADLIYGAIISAVNRPQREYKIYKKYLLKKIIRRLSEVDSAKSLGLEYIPYILNFLGIIYMSLAYDSPHEEDFKIVRNLFENALKHQNLLIQPTHLGCIYYHLGQLYESASLYMGKKPSAYLRGAIKNMHTAQKYLGKFTYPYHYGYICYKLSELYFKYWKQSEDIQALRDAVFQLREAEKIFTQVLFPEFWGHIEGSLGHMLQNLGNLAKSRDICQLAINAYQNQQKIITERRQPGVWAEIQNKIGEIYYLQGKVFRDSDYFEEALACFHDALYIFETHKDEAMANNIKTSIAKSYQMLSDLRNENIGDS